jgi:hypothetical protein
VTEACWACSTAIDAGEASVPARGVPHRLRAFEGKPVHLRCHGDWNGVAAPATGPKRVERRSALVEGKRLFAEDLAAIRSISVRQARRWLVRLDERYGAVVVGRMDGRRGPRRYTTAEALETIGPRVQSGEAAVLERLMDLEARVERLERARHALGLLTDHGCGSR